MTMCLHDCTVENSSYGKVLYFSNITHLHGIMTKICTSYKKTKHNRKKYVYMYSAYGCLYKSKHRRTNRNIQGIIAAIVWFTLRYFTLKMDPVLHQDRILKIEYHIANQTLLTVLVEVQCTAKATE